MEYPVAEQGPVRSENWSETREDSTAQMLDKDQTDDGNPDGARVFGQRLVEQVVCAHIPQWGVEVETLVIVHLTVTRDCPVIQENVTRHRRSSKRPSRQGPCLVLQTLSKKASADGTDGAENHGGTAVTVYRQSGQHLLLCCISN